jgi:hypothetical protein
MVSTLAKTKQNEKRNFGRTGQEVLPTTVPSSFSSVSLNEFDAAIDTCSSDNCNN